MRRTLRPARALVATQVVGGADLIGAIRLRVGFMLFVMVCSPCKTSDVNRSAVSGTISTVTAHVDPTTPYNGTRSLLLVQPKRVRSRRICTVLRASVRNGQSAHGDPAVFEEARAAVAATAALAFATSAATVASVVQLRALQHCACAAMRRWEGTVQFTEPNLANKQAAVHGHTLAVKLEGIVGPSAHGRHSARHADSRRPGPIIRVDRPSGALWHGSQPVPCPLLPESFKFGGRLLPRRIAQAACATAHARST